MGSRVGVRVNSIGVRVNSIVYRCDSFYADIFLLWCRGEWLLKFLWFCCHRNSLMDQFKLQVNFCCSCLIQCVILNGESFFHMFTRDQVHLNQNSEWLFYLLNFLYIPYLLNCFCDMDILCYICASLTCKITYTILFVAMF